MVKIDQLTGHEIESHGIDREVAANQVILQTPRFNPGVFRRSRVILLSRLRHIDSNSIQHEFDGAESAVLSQLTDPSLTEVVKQLNRQASTGTLQHKIEISQATPRVMVNFMEQSITHCTTDKSQPVHA